MFSKRGEMHFNEAQSIPYQEKHKLFTTSSKKWSSHGQMKGKVTYRLAMFRTPPNLSFLTATTNPN